MGAAVVNSEEGFREVWIAELPLEKRMFCQYPLTTIQVHKAQSLSEVERYVWTSIPIQEAEIEGRKEDASSSFSPPVLVLHTNRSIHFKHYVAKNNIRVVFDPVVLDLTPFTTSEKPLYRRHPFLPHRFLNVQQLPPMTCNNPSNALQRYPPRGALLHRQPEQVPPDSVFFKIEVSRTQVLMAWVVHVSSMPNRQPQGKRLGVLLPRSSLGGAIMVNVCERVRAGVGVGVDLDLEDRFCGSGSGGAEGFNDVSLSAYGGSPPPPPPPVVLFYGIHPSSSSYPLTNQNVFVSLVDALFNYNVVIFVLFSTTSTSHKSRSLKKPRKTPLEPPASSP
ncbi:hypothetical protein BDP27DRAFT_1371682 [Rhodocollybia butyracea]|uniref:Uncharacterized protein n=1 Tax=Rhodocollybia butyracea TaxID=206335 RepID=A0A9P5P9W8_9AGAR|nr:hypothetical protein BDP27DRAFT_1371682 [Rhodocollybia butyracea]